MSKLASIQKIIDIKAIEGADKVELAFVLGWQVVVKKGEFQVGDKCIYIQIDTVVPETEQFEFLRERNFRVKTIKLRKQLSQGLIIPLANSRAVRESVIEGQDVTESIGVKKYEKIDNNPQKYEKPKQLKIWYKKWIYLFKYNYLYNWFPNLRPKTRSPFPTHLVGITDEERIQNIPQILKDYKNKKFIVSYKLDGSSITIIHEKILRKSKFRICSRRFELHDKKNDWYNVFINTKFDQEILKLVKYFKTDAIIVQGECIGKFNGNHHNLTQDDIRLFNIYVNGKRLKQNEFYEVCKKWNIPCCPFYQELPLNHTMEEIIAKSDLNDPLNNKVPVEGLVWRCIEDNTSFKVINNRYLLNEK